MPQSHYTLAGIPACERVRDLLLKELPMPDLDQIKQEEQERGTGVAGFQA
jgi:hypothetical protein